MFFCIPASWESYMTPRRPIGVRRGEGALTGSPPFLLVVAWKLQMTPSRTATHFFIAIRIKVNIPVCEGVKSYANLWILAWHTGESFIYSFCPWIRIIILLGAKSKLSTSTYNLRLSATRFLLGACSALGLMWINLQCLQTSNFFGKLFRKKNREKKNYCLNKEPHCRCALTACVACPRAAAEKFHCPHMCKKNFCFSFSTYLYCCFSRSSFKI